MFVDFVPSSRSVLVLDTAGRLDRDLATLAAYVDDLRDRLHGDARASLLVNALARIIVTGQLLRTQALDAAVAPESASIEIHERALRARMNVVVRALFALKQNERWLSLPASVGRFRSLRDFNVYVIDQVAQIHALWLEHRCAEQRLDEATQRALAYTALDDAEIAFERLGRDADVERFLRLGASNGCAAVATACCELAATFGIALTSPGEERGTTHPADGLKRRTAS